MHPIVSLAVDYVRRNSHLFVPVAFSVLAAISSIHRPAQHQLLINSASWALLCIASVLSAGFRPTETDGKRRAWLAGGFLALSYICDRAACDKEGIWSTKGLIPLLVVLLSQNDALSKHLSQPSHTSRSSDDPTILEQRVNIPSFRLLVIMTLSASLVLWGRSPAPATATLGISSVIFAATGLLLFGNAMRSSRDTLGCSNPHLTSVDSASVRQKLTDGSSCKERLEVLRDVAAVIALVCGLGAYFIEPKISSSAISWEPVYQFSGNIKTVHQFKTAQKVLLLTCIDFMVQGLMFIMISQQGAVPTSCLHVFALICAKLRFDVSVSGVWFATLYALSAFLSVTGGAPFSTYADIRTLLFRRGLLGVTIVSICLFYFHRVFSSQYHITEGTPSDLYTMPPANPHQPLAMDLGRGHPAAQLISSAEKEFQATLNRQSKSLGDAVIEYRRRNGIAPPPYFDKWYEFATRNGVILIDEFDTITQSLLPYWSLKPSTIRSRIRDALGYEDNALIGVLIRDGSIVKVEGGPEWQQQATAGMMESFVQYLPDMDLGFNIHDEPRVIVSNDRLSVMVQRAREAIASIAKKESPRNAFSPRPSDVNKGHRIEEVSTTQFNRFAHQQTWTHTRLSCPTDSQAQQFEDQAPDNITSYGAGPLTYVYNYTAFTDICNSPSFSSTYGFFERPNAFSVTYDLTPIFSQSKLSSFQDILFPSPWYWFGKVDYEESHDTTWENKTNSLYWRGSTTGGFSRKGGWRRQHRQRIVQRLNALDKANITVPADGYGSPAHKLHEVKRRAYESIIDVKFSHIGQCDPGDCDAQKEFFEVVEHAEGQDAWYHKHLLDMDGNAFSGRFYSFLKSKSLTYKMAVFREWHHEWLKPWVHYVPLSLIGDEHLDVVQWFSGVEVKDEQSAREGNKKIADKSGNGNSLGEKKAREIAERSREWAGKALRNVDFEVWLFRLLLEYGRIIDDDRENIGYPGP